MPVTPQQLTDARKKAQVAMQRAYGPVHEVNGAHLCWAGRITLAMEKGNKAIAGDDMATLAKINDGVSAISNAAKVDYDAARQAMAHYVKLHEESNVKANTEGMEIHCTCPGCQVAMTQDRAREKLHEMREATQALLFPNAERGTSLLVELVNSEEGSNRKLLWDMLKTIARVQQEYVQAVQSLGGQPAWQRTLT
jgi:hypothetical protein